MKCGIHPLERLVCGQAAHHQCRIGLHVDIVYFTADFPPPSQKFQWQSTSLQHGLNFILHKDSLCFRRGFDLGLLLHEQAFHNVQGKYHGDEAYRSGQEQAMNDAFTHWFRLVLALAGVRRDYLHKAVEALRGAPVPKWES